MIAPNKLAQLQYGQRRRKLALCFGALERDIAGIAEKGAEYNFSSLTRSEYSRKLLEILLTDPGLSPEAREDLKEKLSTRPFEELRSCNAARNHLLTLLGTLPGEWDLIIAPHNSKREKDGTLAKRRFFPGIEIYAEDIRSPFNLGAIFRSAEAFGAEKVFVSPLCCDPLHPRCQRSSMGCVETLLWERRSLENLPEEEIFVLETGGIPLKNFQFPKKGIVIIGSEELGVSPEALKKANAGCVSIPLIGQKESLNVSVAFGILMNAWINSL